MPVYSGTYSTFKRRRSSPGLVYEKVGPRPDYKFSREREYLFDGEIGSLVPELDASLVEKDGKTVVFYPNQIWLN